jgi:heme-degrading monooxygenase HmoA
VIARVWTARAPKADAPRYVEYFRSHVVPELRAIAGYSHAIVLVRSREVEAEIVVITRWSSLDAIRAFAGDALTTAVVHDAAAVLLTDFDREVKHYEIEVED